MSQHLYAQSFSENPLADPIIHGSLSGDSAAAAWQSAAYDLLLEPGTSWRSPAFDVEPLSYVRLSFRARLKADEILAAPTASRYNRNHLSIKSINPDATWNLDPLYAGPSGGDLIADDNTSLVNLSDQWTEQVFYSRVQANARQASVSLAAIDAAYFIDDIKIESVADQLDVSAWIDGIWSQRFYSSALVQAPEINTPISSEQQFRLARTLAKLQAGQSVRIVLCGDSIVNDLSNSGFDVLLERAFPGASVSMITAVGGGTGMDQWNPSNSTYPFISSSSYRGALNFNQAIAEQEPDLVILGGISTPANQSGYAAFQDIISKLRSGALISRLGYQPDILIATGAFGSVATSWNPSLQLTATQGNYRGSLLQIANTNNVGFWDLTQAWGEYLLASLNSTDPQAIHSPLSRQHYWRDNVHANTFGKQILGRALTDYLATAEPASLDSPVVSLSVSPDLVTEDGAAGLSFTFSRTGSTAESLDVFFTVDGTAVSGSDYSGLEGTGGRFSIVIPSGSASATLTIKPIVDNLAESDESVVLVLDSLAGRGYTIATDTPVTGIIKNVDAQVGLSVSPAMVEEDGGETLIFIFRRVGDLSKALAVHYAMSGSASADSDYIGVDSSSATHTVLFDPGSDTASLVIKPIADTVFESNETVVLTVLSGSGYSFGSSASATGVIKNDDPKAVAISSITDNVGSIQGPIAEGAFSNDTTPTLSGSLSAALGSGERLSIYRNGSLAGYASVSGASWSFTPSTAITASGLQSFSAAVVDGAGNTGPLSPARSFLLDSNAETTWTYDWGSASPLGTTPGILLARVSLQSPRSGEPNLKVTALRVDLTTPGLRLTATGPSADWQANTRETVTSTTRGFVSTSRQEGTPVVAAINTAFFTLTNGSQAVPANLKGLAVRDGVVVSPAENGFSALLIDPITGARIEQISSTSVADPTSLQLAVSGGQFAEGIVLSNGIPSGDTITQNARSALGLSQDRRYLTMLTVDRELRDFTPSYYGATRRDVGTILAGMGSHTGMNLDGGGSTQMAWWNPTSGASELLNAPLGGVERFVGSNLGVVYQQPLVEALG